MSTRQAIVASGILLLVLGFAEDFHPGHIFMGIVFIATGATMNDRRKRWNAKDWR